ncbi:hypothetical protein DVK00_04660 [Haloarcula sp. Atlit-47R]|uniref:hypothetical protein n=1 Tax=Haloarcula sp. Atlit-47R TaxID=2282132 RepID=UPI000EF252F3|nr:hypothetical protein [Haloarcula sp. Atlit-47R]RLM47805.1 hypothetical protein DVK00_04660 [Haloarcula sp. Atlit-47R]
MAITGNVDYDESIPDEEQEDEQFDDFEIGDFFENSRSLFAVLGVFAALSIYLLRLSVREGSSWPEKTGFAASLTLFLLVSYALLKKANNKYGFLVNFLDHILLPQWRNVEFIMFIVPFSILLISIIGIASNYISSFLYILRIMSFLLGTPITILLFEKTSWMIDSNTDMHNASAVEFIKASLYLITIPVVSLFLSTLFSGYLLQSQNLQVSMLFEFTSGDPVELILLSFSYGAAIAAFLLLFAIVFLLFLSILERFYILVQ